MLIHEFLWRHAIWLQPGYVSTVHREPALPLTPICYRIRIEGVTGHRATADEAEIETETSAAAAPATEAKRHGWLHDLLYPARAKR